MSVAFVWLLCAEIPRFVCGEADGPVWIAVADRVEIRLVVDVRGCRGGRVPVAHRPVLGVVPGSATLVFTLTPRRWVGVVAVVAQGRGGTVEVVPSGHRG